MKSKKINNHTVYTINSYTIINTPYNWPAFLTASCLIRCTSSYEYITKDHIAMHSYNTILNLKQL